MTDGVVKTQGTHLFFVDTLSSSVPVILKFACPTGITGLGGAKEPIEKTCLDDTVDKQFIAGLGNPGQVSVPFNFKPGAVSHQVLFDLKESAEVLQWLICLSDGTADPTLNSSEKLVPPASPKRTSLEIQAYVADINIDIATADIVRGTLTLQRSGPVVPYWNGPYSA